MLGTIVGWVSFLSTPSARRATLPVGVLSRAHSQFLSTPSARRATGSQTRPTTTSSNFYPRPPRGGRPLRQERRAGSLRFLSTPSARRATPTSEPPAQPARYFYPRPPRGGRQRREPDVGGHHAISIHALREEGDCRFSRHRTDGHHFYPRPPRGGRPSYRRHSSSAGLFLSTPSARRATRQGGHRGRKVYISIHALREEGDLVELGLGGALLISIHALREEGDRSSL